LEVFSRFLAPSQKNIDISLPKWLFETATIPILTQRQFIDGRAGNVVYF
jgi:hypothetical protein